MSKCFWVALLGCSACGETVPSSPFRFLGLVGLVGHQVKTVNSQSRHDALSSLLKGLDGSAIVYVMTKKDAEQLAVDVSESQHCWVMWPCAAAAWHKAESLCFGRRVYSTCSSTHTARPSPFLCPTSRCQLDSSRVVVIPAEERTRGVKRMRALKHRRYFLLGGNSTF